MPDDAGDPPVAHLVRGKSEAFYTYRDSFGSINGFVHLFSTSTGGKQTLSVCFAQNSKTGAREWRWMAFPEPRPLYGLDMLEKYPDAFVLLVDGEESAEVAGYIPDFVVVTWQGGSKAVGKSDLRPLYGRNIYVWANCNAQREPLTKEQKAEGVDPASMPCLPEDQQPSMRAMLHIKRAVLKVWQDTDFRFVDIPKPGSKPDGWGAAELSAEKNRTLAHVANFACNVRASNFEKEAQKPKPPPQRKQYEKNKDGLLMRNGQIVPCLANIYDILSRDSRWEGVLGFDEFAYAIRKLKPPPFGGEAGEWDANDDVQSAMWITREYWFAPSPVQVAEAVEALAKDNGFHPVRDYLSSLEWDGVRRIDDWIADYIGAPKNAYVMRVSRWFLMGMVARVMQPGVKFDCCLVLEGDQGRKKSTMLRVLGGEWFGDTDLDLHNKDSMATIRGSWLYEFAEMGSIARSEASRQKSFLSRQIDEFRPPYGRRDIRSPRQLVFAGTVNEWTWNKDETGGRRFWPIICSHDIDCDGLGAVRDQLFAEAYLLYKSGKRFWPTGEEQQKLFDPEQIKRHQSDGYIDLLHQFVSERYDLFSLADAADHLKIDPARLSRDIQTRIGKALRALGCTREEKRTNVIRYWYKPPVRSEATSETGDEIGGCDGIPF